MFNTINKNVNPIYGQEVPADAQTSSQFLKVADPSTCYQTEGQVYKLYLNPRADGAQPVDPNNAGNNIMIPVNIPTIKCLPEGSVIYLTSIQIDQVPGTGGFLDVRSDTFADGQRYDSSTGQKSNILKRIQRADTLQIFEDVRNTSGTTIRNAQALNFQMVHINITDDRGDPIPLSGAGAEQFHLELTIIMPKAKDY